MSLELLSVKTASATLLLIRFAVLHLGEGLLFYYYLEAVEFSVYVCCLFICINILKFLQSIQDCPYVELLLLTLDKDKGCQKGWQIE